MIKLGSNSDTWSPTPLRVIDGGKLNFMDSFKPATFKRSFNTAMDILSKPAKLATKLTGTSGVIDKFVDTRLEHKGRISSMLGNREAKRITQKKDLTDTQKKQMEEHRKHHTPSHIRHMTKLMMDGKSFDDAHEETKKIEGGSLMGDMGRAFLSQGMDTDATNRVKNVAEGFLKKGVNDAVNVGSTVVRNSLNQSLNNAFQ